MIFIQLVIEIFNILYKKKIKWFNKNPLQKLFKIAVKQANKDDLTSSFVTIVLNLSDFTVNFQKESDIQWHKKSTETN